MKQGSKVNTESSFMTQNAIDNINKEKIRCEVPVGSLNFNNPEF
jgi:hypothetical protein